MMNVTKISYLSFTGKIIDSHAHIGKHGTEIYKKEQLDIFVKSPLVNNDTVEKIIVSDLNVLHNIKPEVEGNKTTLKLFKNNDKYAVLASCNPKNGEIKNIKKLFKEYPNQFIGLKFHSDIQQLELSNSKYKPYMEFASKNNLPCLFHSQAHILEDGKIDTSKKHISDPESIYALAKKYKKTPVIMAHMGAPWRESHDKAINILIESIKNGDANLYADVSWVDIDDSQTHIVKAIKRLKGIGEKDWKYGDQSYRLMFGTDAPLGRFAEENSRNIYSNFVDRIKKSIREDKDLKPNAEKIIDDLFYNNAKKLYFSKKKSQPLSHKTFFIPCLIALCGLIIYKLHKDFKKHTKQDS